MVIHKIISSILGDPHEKAIKSLAPKIKQINEIFNNYEETLKVEDIKSKTEEFKQRVKNGETLDSILPEAFALVKFACKSLVGKSWEVRGQEVMWNIVPYDVQMIGGIIIHEGKIAEMKTGEGKTLVCTFPVYLNALEEKGVHVVTVNEYLAHRDAEWMKGLYECLGLSVGVIHSNQNPDEKKAAYACDITYGTNNEYGFDYLRDNMAVDLNDLSQRDLHYAIVDEVDSILIDEARTPLIISAPAQESTSKYSIYSKLIPSLVENEHYNVDEKMRVVTLSEAGIAKMEELLKVDNIYTDAGFSEVHHIEQALKAQAIFKKDIDYVVKDGEVIIVDEFTGRLMPGRRYSDGLHQAIEAKENVEIKKESRTLATITFQNYFRLYKKLAGMTGTAVTEAEEFYKIYGLDTVVIPTNIPVARKDLNDSIFKNEAGKFKAVARKVKELNENGQPVLIGTISIEKSEVLSKLLSIQGVKHKVLNAKHHEMEADIISKAGQKSAVTIATNMAGRGTDIKLGEEVKELGGLAVIGTERHESRRIDNQLRGRSGRQGDPGFSQFYVSMEDSLMRLFGSDKIRDMMNALNFPEDMPIENGLISRSIESAQKRVEGHNFDIRKHVVEYDDVMNKQRSIIYTRRKKMLTSENVKNDILLLIEQEVEALVLNHTIPKNSDEWNYQEIHETINAIHKNSNSPLALEDLTKITEREELIAFIKSYLWFEYEEKEKLLPDAKLMRDVEKKVYLRAIDTLWMEHIDEMSHLREAVALQGYGQKNPLTEYQQEGYQKFQKLLDSIRSNTVYTLFHLRIQQTQDLNITQKIVGESNSAEIESNLTDDEKNIKETASHLKEKLIFHSGQQSVNRSTVKSDEKPGRNEPCNCGSGKKNKKCCGKN